MVARLMHQTKMTILLSLNAVVILIVGIMIFSAINLNDGIEFKVVSARSDDVASGLTEVELLAPSINMLEAAPVVEKDENVAQAQSNFSSASINAAPVPAGQLWNETALTMYTTTDIDLCVGGGLTNLGEMYWQSDNKAVIAGFSTGAPRVALGYDPTVCKTPVIVGPGTTTVTAGTYDGRRRDQITITVLDPPVEQWKRDVLALVNQERANNGLAPLAWGGACAAAADVRVREITTQYSHTRPDGTPPQTACPAGAQQYLVGENLAAGGYATSPTMTVATWMASPDHRANILNPDFKYLTVGFIFDPSLPYKTYWSQIFSAI